MRAIDATLGTAIGKEVLVVGSGKMALSSLRALEGAGARTGIAARRVEAAEELADQFDAFALPLHAIEDALVTVDAAIFATSTPEPLLGPDAMARILKERDGNPLILIDLGLPRNVDPDVARLEGNGHPFALYDLERLDHDEFTVRGGHEEMLTAASEITTTEAERCVAWFRSKPADAVVAAIQGQAARIADIEVAYAMRRIPGLDERQREAVELVIRRTVRKLVHLPTVRAKEACARGDDNVLDAARWLFGIDGEEHDARSTARRDRRNGREHDLQTKEAGQGASLRGRTGGGRATILSGGGRRRAGSRRRARGRGHSGARCRGRRDSARRAGRRRRRKADRHHRGNARGARAGQEAPPAARERSA